MMNVCGILSPEPCEAGWLHASGRNLSAGSAEELGFRVAAVGNNKIGVNKQ